MKPNQMHSAKHSQLQPSLPYVTSNDTPIETQTIYRRCGRKFYLVVQRQQRDDK